MAKINTVFGFINEKIKQIKSIGSVKI